MKETETRHTGWGKVNVFECYARLLKFIVDEINLSFIGFAVAEKDCKFLIYNNGLMKGKEDQRYIY